MMEWINIGKLDLVNTLASALAGGLVGLGLVHFVAWKWRPRVTELGFNKSSFNLGQLYKLHFKLSGRAYPGLCCLRIEWSGRSVLAKWDETTNPVERDDPTRFVPELVPSTYYLPLLLKLEYAVPIVIEHEGKREVFSGWWFGRKRFDPDPSIPDGSKIRLTLTGGDLHWSKEFSLSEICGE